MKLDWNSQHKANERAINLNISSIDARLNRLTDAYLDSALDREMYERKKTELLLEKKQLEERNTDLTDGTIHIPDVLEEFLELVGMAYLGYKMAIPDERRDMVENLTSNRIIFGKNVVVELRNPFQVIAKRSKTTNGDPYRGEYRTSDTGIRTELENEVARVWDPLILRLSEILSKEPMTFKS